MMAIYCSNFSARRCLFVVSRWKCTLKKRGSFFSTSVHDERVAPLDNSERVTAKEMLSSSHVKHSTSTMNIDMEDVIRHESFEDWWDPEGFMMGLHRLNDLRISLIRNGLENTGQLKGEEIKTNPKYLKGIKILEVGCGAGILSEPLARLGADVTGIDPGLKLITLAKLHAAEHSSTLESAPNYINTNIEDHSLSNNNVYDVVVASEVIEHVPNKELFVDACVKTLKPGGSIFITAPNRTTAAWLELIVLAEDVLRVLPKGLHSWDSFITHNELKLLLGKYGCKTILINGIIYNLLTSAWFWSSTTELHYALHAVKVSTPMTAAVKTA